MFRHTLIWLFRHIVDIYFLRVEATGTTPAHDTGGRLFVANHVNGLIDPLLVLTSAPCAISPVAKSTLWNIRGLRWLLDAANAVPIVRRQDNPNKTEGANDAAFERVASWLDDGGNILIFPEGTSHNEPHVLKVRSGAARMLLRAYRRGHGDITLQAVALEFDARQTFRSRCLVVYGPVRRVADHAGEEATDESVVAAITEQVQDDLGALLVEGATWDDRVLIARVAEMFAHDGGDASLARWNEVGRQVKVARETLATLDDERIRTVRDAVDGYYEQLDSAGLSDHQVVGPTPVSTKRSVLTLAFLIAALPFACVGVLLFYLPYQAPRWVAATAKENDVVSTYKLGTGLVVFPLSAAIWIGVAVWLLSGLQAALCGLVIVVSPFAVLLFANRSRPFRRALSVARRSQQVSALHDARAETMAVLTATQVMLDQQA